MADAIRNGLRGRPLELEPSALKPALYDTVAIARRHKLSVSDAAHLELSLRRQLPLATLDDDLRRAAKKAGLALA